MANKQNNSALTGNDFVNTKALAEELWLSLVAKKAARKAEITKIAFVLQVTEMINKLKESERKPALEGIAKSLISMEARATELLEECQQTKKLLEEEAVSTVSNTDRHLATIRLEARRRIREKLLKPNKMQK